MPARAMNEKRCSRAEQDDNAYKSESRSVLQWYRELQWGVDTPMNGIIKRWLC